jgi:peptidoglycan/LPS O-acetylase OafA/YrhL
MMPDAATLPVRVAVSGRTVFIDHLRVALTALVLFHHAAITYGAAGGWYLREAPEGSSLALTVFVALNQAFFMGFFFLIAGYFTPGSYDRKGPWRFASDRLLRLGLPLLVFGFVLDPLTVALAHAHSVPDVFAIWGRMMSRLWFSSGPLWFAQALLNFAAAYMVWRAIAGPPPRAERPLPGHGAIFASAVAVGAAAFLLRLEWPVGEAVSNLQLGYFASYIVMFAAGVAAVRGRWLERVGPSLAGPWLAVSAVALLGFLAAIAIGGTRGYAGGWTVKAAIYAFFEPFFAWGVILGLLLLFRTRLNVPMRWSAFLAGRAYTVYVIHPPVLVGVALALQPLDAPMAVKFLLAGTLACVASTLAASAILLVPGARRVL